MLWTMTGSCSRRDGLLYVIEAETEEEVYEKVAKSRGMLYKRIDREDTEPAVEGEGLDDKDSFSKDDPFHILIYDHKDKTYIPLYVDLENDEDFSGFICYACPVETGVNLSDIVLW